MKRLCLLLCWTLSVQIVSFAAQGDVVFEKSLSTSQKVTLVKKEIPYVEPSKEQQEKMQKAMPGLSLRRPQHVYQFTMQLKSGDEKPAKTIWSKDFMYIDDGPAVPSEFKILDVQKSGGNLIIAYKDGPDNHFQKIVSVDEPGLMKVEPATRFFRDSPAFGKIVTEASFATNAQGGLSIKGKFIINKTVIWNLEGSEWKMTIADGEK